MTTPPRARRFHASPAESVNPEGAARPSQGTGLGGAIRVEVARKAAPDAAPAPQAEADEALRRLTAVPEEDDGFAAIMPKTKPTAAEPGLQARLDGIRAENLSQRQLRIARRVAVLHQIEVQSDEEAVLRLRERGIDPAHRSSLGKILAERTTPPAPPPPKPANDTRKTLVPVPKTVPAKVPAPLPASPASPLPSREDLTEERRATQIYQIQRDLARRRRRRMLMLMLRLIIFVLIPTAAVSWYYTNVASPLYATVSQFKIQSADGLAGHPGGMMASSALALNPDAVAVQSYLTSRDAMLRLDDDLGFKRAFQDPSIDPIRRLPPDATNEAAYRIYANSVKIGYDPTEGVLNMEVIAPDPLLSQQFSMALISYAEEQVDQLTARLRTDQMAGANENYEDAEAKMMAAQQRVQRLQEQLGVLDPAAESGVVMGQVSNLEGQLTQKQLELGQLLANPAPVESRVNAVRGDIARLREMIAETRLLLTENIEGRTSLTAITGELRVAEAELMVRQQLLAAAAEQMEIARIEANKQVRYLSQSVAPVPPDEATYPKAFQNTLVALLLFSGIYLMLSLTASILREQVST